MEIIHLILGKANPERMNGVNKVVHQLATKQAEANKTVSVWGITKDLSVNFKERNFETLLFQAAKNPFSIDDSLKKAILSKKNVAVFHLHGGWIPVYYSLSKLFQKANISFVITAHGAYNKLAMQKSKWTKKVYFHLFERKVLDRTSKIHCIGESEISGLKNFYNTNKTELIPYGFDANIIINKKPKVSEKFNIGFVGRLDIHTKGLDLLIQAFSRFEKEHEDSELWIVGDSKEKLILEQRIEKQKINRILLLGSKFGAAKFSLMEEMDVFVHPSRNEGLPASILEAASMEIPCIVSKATNLYSLIKEYNAGKGIEDDNAEALYFALKELYKDYKNKQLEVKGQNAQKMVVEKFNWKELVPKLDKLYI